MQQIKTYDLVYETSRPKLGKAAKRAALSLKRAENFGMISAAFPTFVARTTQQPKHRSNLVDSGCWCVSGNYWPTAYR
jgi:hypothetical protein